MAIGPGATHLRQVLLALTGVPSDVLAFAPKHLDCIGWCSSSSLPARPRKAGPSLLPSAAARIPPSQRMKPLRCFETSEVEERHPGAVNAAVPKSRFSVPSSDGQSMRFAFAKRR